MDEMLARFGASMKELEVEARVGPPIQIAAGINVAPVELRRGASKQDYMLLYGPALRFADVTRAPDSDAPILLFTEFTSPKTAESLRRAGVQHLDTARNAWIAFGDVLIDVRGRRRPALTRPRQMVATENLFSASRAQVIFALLAWPELWEASRRELAHAAGVSLGQAHSSLRLLHDAGYGARRLNAQQADLLNLWSAAFPNGLAKRLTLARYQGDLGPIHKLAADDSYFLSGENAIDDVIRPATLTLYVSAFDPHLAIANRWRSDGLANITIRRKFWNTPDDTGVDYEGRLVGLRNAPWPLVYADLLSSDDPRTRSAAQAWRERHDRHAES